MGKGRWGSHGEKILKGRYRGGKRGGIDGDVLRVNKRKKKGEEKKKKREKK